ncbi:DUF927 domain-containing protein [Clostridium sp. E02]|uniref:DUF927 domain-containing protein n=1 Tax=Clostridium sp. E02 TaxID=2487134 RepID=UPI000F5484E9|nr:DUF927 domain-containing protein [Clostridium sp. E02]
MNEPLREYTKEEFNTEVPYELLYSHRDDGFQYMQMFNDLSSNAEKVGFRRFGTMVKAYLDQHGEKKGINSVVNNVTNFKDQPIELYTGNWNADDEGITRRNDNQGLDIACTHPILPVQRLINVEDGNVRLRIMYRRNFERWESVVAEKKTLFTANGIKDLANKDISVSDKNASYLVEYLQNIDDLNHNVIPRVQSVSHLGWTKNGLFCPYTGGLEFDGQDNFKMIFDSVHSEGKLEEWVKVVRKVRETDSPARIALAASFASAILKTIGKLNFIVHLWGGSETGKTVAQLLAVSVWADPNDDASYMQTFNGTVVGLEQQASFVNNLPLILDEFQLVKDKKSFEQAVYMLCEGIGKTRGAKTGGLQNTPTWKNCTITSGESPITHNASGGGAVNRIIEVECREKLFKDVHGLLDAIRTNYGHAGRIFMGFLSVEEARDKAKRYYNQFYQELGTASTEKQTMAGAAILAADALATEWIFCDGRALTVKDIEKSLHSKEAVDVGVRGFEYIQDFCVSNQAKFERDADPCYGTIKGDEVRIIRANFEKICDEGGFNGKALLSWLDQKGRLFKDNKGNLYKSSKVNGKSVRCACIDLAEKQTEFEPVGDVELPFK